VQILCAAAPRERGGLDDRMYMALYRRFRPETFEKVWGQEHIVKILTNQIRSGTTGHAYLFCGTRGTGKTTMARLLAKGVNCLSAENRPCGVCEHCAAIRDGVFVDVIEIDAASNTGVDNIRELRESVKYPPSVGRCKVYIIDEVHMLSKQAFNALLKTLEEPPENVIFVLATTEPQDLPATILSRCLRLEFRRVPAAVIRRGMKEVCAAAGIDAAEDALALLSNNADGSVRDGLSLLDQCAAAEDGTITRDTVLEFLGSPGEALLTELTALVAGGDVAGALTFLDRMLAEGKEERQLIKDWIGHFRNLMLLRHVKDPADILNLSVENIEALKKQNEALSPAFVHDSIFALAKTLNDIRWSTYPRVLLEVGIIRMAEGPQAAAQAAPATSVASAAPPPARAAAPPDRQPKVTAPETAAAERTPVGQPEAAAATSLASADPPPARAAAPAAAVEPSVTAPSPAPAVLPPAAIDWNDCIRELMEKKPLLRRLAGRSRLAEVGPNTFLIEAFDDITLRVVEDSADLTESLMTGRLGAAMKMKCQLRGDDPNSGEAASPKTAEDGAEVLTAQAADELAKRIGQTFNINVEVR
jgi:DNA polymerase-3 subunit gamma/tau